jgi:DNA-binding NtrC family response regulator
MQKLRTIVDQIIFDRLKHFNFNRSHTAKSLGLCLRTIHGLVRRLRNQGFEIPEGMVGTPVRRSRDSQE